jgi:hypothetical protein
MRLRLKPRGRGVAVTKVLGHGVREIVHALNAPAIKVGTAFLKTSNGFFTREDILAEVVIVRGRGCARGGGLHALEQERASGEKSTYGESCSGSHELPFSNPRASGVLRCFSRASVFTCAVCADPFTPRRAPHRTGRLTFTVQRRRETSPLARAPARPRPALVP